MPIKVHIPTPMRQHTGGAATVDVVGATVQGALDNLCTQCEGIAGRLFDNGQLRRFVNIYLNDEDIRFLDGPQTVTKDGDELSIIPAVAGG